MRLLPKSFKANKRERGIEIFLLFCASVSILTSPHQKNGGASVFLTSYTGANRKQHSN